MRSNKLSSYEKKILFPLQIANAVLVLYSILNLFVPTYAGTSLGCTRVYAYISIICAAVGVIGMHGYFNQIVPVPAFAVNRLVQLYFHFIRHSASKINIWVFIALCVADAFLVGFLLADRAEFIYEEEDE